MEPDLRPIALMDSGVGGLSILRETRRLLPSEDILYFADQGHVPYGPRPRDEIRQFSAGITRFFLSHDVKLIVIACNAASAASLHYLRGIFPGVGFVGMEPAIKPASERTRTGVIGVLTTKATFQGELFASLMDKYAHDLKVVVQICPEFVTLVEAGQLDTDQTRSAARSYLQPIIEAGADQIVLGCTHFPFLTPLLMELLPAGVEIIDPGSAVARQTGRMLEGKRNDPARVGHIQYFTSGNRPEFAELASRLMVEKIEESRVTGVTWQMGEIVIADGSSVKGDFHVP
jgi:glutamate racemase